MWINLKGTLRAERYQTLARRVDRLQDLLNKSRDESDDEPLQGLQEFFQRNGQWPR